MEPVTFQSRIDRFEMGFTFHCLEIPPEVIQRYEKPVGMRMLGTLNGAPFELAIRTLKAKEGGYFLSMGKQLCQAAKVRVGDPVIVTMWPHPNPAELDIPEEFALALEQAPEAAEKFNALTLGRRRSLMYYIRSAKQEETRIKRSWEMIERMLNDQLYIQRTSKQKDA